MVYVRLLAQGAYTSVVKIIFAMALGYLALAAFVLPLFLSLVLTFWSLSGAFDLSFGPGNWIPQSDQGHQAEKHLPTEEHVPTEKPRANCTKFILFTTQRSGSTWFCEALGHQREVYCPEMSELLIGFSGKLYRDVSAKSAEEWTRAADDAFARVCADAEQQGKRIAGFKLMYDQVKGPFQTVESIKLPEAWFKNYLLKSQVRIVHLVREAVILRLASNFQTGVNVKRKLKFYKANMTSLKNFEKEHRQWFQLLKRSGLPYHYLSYEDLVSFRHDAVVHMVLQFLGVKNTISYSRLQGAFLRIHDAACENRIAHWNEVKELLKGTMSLRACNMLSAGEELSSDTPCTKFILLTTQRSGSTSFCQNLGNHPEVYCPESELLVNFSFRQYKDFVSPEEWTRAADDAFARVCSDAEEQGKQIAGFQLMYNQVKGPFQTVENTKLPEAWFMNYLLSSEVRIVHLVREAVILRLASPFRTTLHTESEESNILENTMDPPDASDVSTTQKFHFQKRHLRKLLRWEMEHKHWLQLLMKHSNLPYQYVRFEDVIFRRDLLLYTVWQFLGASQMPHPPSEELPDFNAIYGGSCEDRIENWDETKSLLNGTMSLQACNILSVQFSL
eukprot:s3252_g3.t2